MGPLSKFAFNLNLRHYTSYSAAILCRERCMVVHLEQVKVLITAEEVYLQAGVFTRSCYSSTWAPWGHMHGLRWVMWPKKLLKLS